MVLVHGVQDIEGKLERELVSGLEACQEEVMGFMRPVEALTQAQVCRVHASPFRLLGALHCSVQAAAAACD